jgi:Uma2 family endonuclease
MRPQTIIPVEEYLKTVYRPDRDYVDGVVEDRNVGENDHSYLQKKLLLFLAGLEQELGIYVVQEQRVQIAATRFRIPDTCIMLGGRPAEPIFTTPPLICIEVLSPEDRYSRLQERIGDYLKFGVREVWVLDPKAKRAWVHDPQGSREVLEGALHFQAQGNAPEIVVPLLALFE